MRFSSPALITCMLILTACTTNKVLDTSPVAGPTAHIRIFSLPNNTYLYPNQACYKLGSPVEILAHSGGKTFGGFNAFAVLGGNKKIGMPETNDMTWSHHEFSVSATNPLTIAVTLQNDGQNASGRFYSSGCGPIAGYFNPESGKDYDAALVVERGRCYLRVRELVPNKLTGEVKPSEIALTPASTCK